MVNLSRKWYVVPETPMLVKIKCLSSLDYQAAEQTMAAAAAWLLIAKSSLFDKEKSNHEIVIHLKVWKLLFV